VKQPLSEKEWEKFFDLLGRIVDADVPTVADKIRLVKEAADRQEGEADMNLEEFMSWNFGY
jgi:hypothetical protein